MKRFPLAQDAIYDDLYSERFWEVTHALLLFGFFFVESKEDDSKGGLFALCTLDGKKDELQSFSLHSTNLHI